MKSDANLAFRGVLRFFFSLKTCTKLKHEKTWHQFFKLVPAGSSRKTSITCNFFRFLLSKSDGFLIFNGASQKFAIFSENLDFWVPPRNFSSNQGGQSIRQTKGYPTRALIFLVFFPPFYQEMPKYGSKHGFWTWNQHLWTLKCLETKIHPTSPRHLYSKRDIGIFYFLIIIKGCLYNTCVFVWLTFGQFVKHCFCCFSKHFWVSGKCMIL